MAHGIKKEYVEFKSEWALKNESGLLSRLKEMPRGEFFFQSKPSSKIMGVKYKQLDLNSTLCTLVENTQLIIIALADSARATLQDSKTEFL